MSEKQQQDEAFEELFQECVYDSGYALTRREEGVASYFLRAGLDHGRRTGGVSYTERDVKRILAQYAPKEAEQRENAIWVMDIEAENIKDELERSVVSCMQFHYDEYTDWDCVCGRVLQHMVGGGSTDKDAPSEDRISVAPEKPLDLQILPEAEDTGEDEDGWTTRSESNLELISRVCEFSNLGPVMQMFLMHAIWVLIDQVRKGAPNPLGALVVEEAWKQAAEQWFEALKEPRRMVRAKY